jgi:hypothetical protein
MHATEHPGEPAWIHRSHEAQPKSATPSWMAPPLVREPALGLPPEMADHEGGSYSGDPYGGEVPRPPPVPGDAHYSHEGEALREENAALVEENVSLRDAHAALHAEHAALRAEHAALTERFDAVALVRAASEALGGKGGGGRRDMAQAGGPDGDKAQAALEAVAAAMG